MMLKSSIKRAGSFMLLGALLVLAMYMAGCGQKDQSPATQPDQSSKELIGSLTIAGSTSVQPFSEVLAEKFMAENPKVHVDVQGGGSSQGVEAAISGAADIGSSSREITPEEKAKGLVDTQIAMDGIAVVVHPSNQIAELKSEDVKNIYLGNVKNWKELGGADADITVVCREEGSGTRTAFEELVMNKEKISNQVIIQQSTGAVATTVAGDANAIGFVSLASVNDQVKALKIDGVEASVDNVKSKTYKLSRPFLYLTKGDAQGLAKAFIDYVLSDAGQAIMVEEGAISIK